MRTFIMIALVLVGAGTVSAQQPAAYNFSSPVQAYPAGYAPQPMAPTMQPGMTPTAVAPQPAYFNNAAGCDAGGCDANGNVWNGGRRFGLGNGLGNGGCDAGNCGGAGCDNGNCGGGAGCDGGNCGGGIGGGRGLFGGLLGMGLFNRCCGVGGASGNGVYHNLFGGFSESNNMNLDAMSTPGSDDLDLSMKNGWLVGRAWGHQVDCNWRTEIETAYRNNSASDFEVGGVGGADVAGRLNVLTGMVNIVRDLRPMGRCGDIRPYVGAGAGIAFLDLETDSTVPGGYLDTRDSTFAYQAFVGVSRKVRNCVDLYTEYRFFGLDDFCVNSYDQGDDFVDALQGNLTQHNFLFGMRVWVR